jgi:hypothetical protein
MALLLIEGFEDYGTSTTSNIVQTYLQERYTNPSASLRLYADTDYLVHSSPGQVELFGYSDVTGAVGIAGIQINTAVRETDANSHSLITEVVSGGTTSDDAGQGVGTTSYVNKKRIVELDPATGQPWTASGLNAATIGVKAN